MCSPVIKTSVKKSSQLVLGCLCEKGTLVRDGDDGSVVAVRGGWYRRKEGGVVFVFAEGSAVLAVEDDVLERFRVAHALSALGVAAGHAV